MSQLAFYSAQTVREVQTGKYRHSACIDISGALGD
jgi:hypothetical protein